MILMYVLTIHCYITVLFRKGSRPDDVVVVFCVRDNIPYSVRFNNTDYDSSLFKGLVSENNSEDPNERLFTMSVRTAMWTKFDLIVIGRTPLLNITEHTSCTLNDIHVRVLISRLILVSM